MTISTSAGIEILTLVTMNNMMFQVIMPCSSPAGSLSGIVFDPEDLTGRKGDMAKVKCELLQLFIANAPYIMCG
jgi:hypothetical protein